MSKTKKIKRLNTKISDLESHISVLKWSVDSLRKAQSYKPPSNYYTPRPEIRSNNYEEERYYRSIVSYVYEAMDKEYRKVYDNPAEWNVDPERDCKFVIYMSEDVIHLLSRISGFGDMQYTDGKNRFRGYEVIPLHSKREYVHFVRVY